MNQYDNKTFIELGPWVRGLSYLQHDDLDEGKQFIAPNHAHLHKRTFLRLPRLTEPQHSSTNKSKGVLKMSHQSLDFTSPTPIPQPSARSRYGALNGSVILKTKQPMTGRTVHPPTEDIHTIDTASLQRKVSTVQMGEPVITHRVLRGKGRRLMNEECSKKRGLMQFIREVAHNKDFMKFYLQHKTDRTYSNNLDL